MSFTIEVLDKNIVLRALDLLEKNCYKSVITFLQDNQEGLVSTSLLNNHSIIALEYKVFCSELKKELFFYSQNRQKILEKVTLALLMAEFLSYIYTNYLI